MISILIPTYNYNVLKLVKILHAPAIPTTVDFEILVLDDHSTDDETVSWNSEIGSMEDCTFFQNNKNMGRTKTRQKLAERAKFDWLLFLDADVIPKNGAFLKGFFDAICDDIDLIFGGITYEQNPPETSKMLRWKYGMARENQNLEYREKHPILSINSGAFLIKKSLFLKVNSQRTANNYGLDILFKQLLLKEKANIKHIENPVYHMGLESNHTFLKKSFNAVETMIILENEQLIPADYTALQKSYLKLKKWGLTNIFRSMVSKFQKVIEKNLNSKNPNLYWFDLYRLSHYISLKQMQDA